MATISRDIAVGRDRATVTLRPAYPCCRRRVRLEAVASVPIQRYDRTCPACGFGWTIERTTMAERINAGLRIDKLDWTMTSGGY